MEIEELKLAMIICIACHGIFFVEFKDIKPGFCCWCGTKIEVKSEVRS